MIEIGSPAYQRFLHSVSRMSRLGLKPAFRKIITYMNKKTRERLKRHRTPYGLRIKPVARRKPVKVGDLAIIGLDRREGSKRQGKPILRTVRKDKEARKINRSRASGKDIPALYRSSPRKRKVAPNVTEKVPAARKLYRSLTMRSAPGRIQAIRKQGFVIGSRWGLAHKLGVGRLPRRNLYGMNLKDRVIAHHVILRDVLTILSYKLKGRLSLGGLKKP